MITTYRKQVVKPLVLYNIYIQTYNRYFNNFFTPTRKKELNNTKIEDYFINFADSGYLKLGESQSKMKEFILWLFAKHGRIPIFNIHCYVDEYLKESKNTLDSFYFNIVDYLNRNKIIGWDSYIRGTRNTFPKIIEHYTSTKDFPFDFIVYLKVLDSLTEHQKKIAKMLLRKDLMTLDKASKRVEENKDFFRNELEQIMGSLNGR